MSSRSVVDLRKRKAGHGMRLLPLHESPKRETLRARRKRGRVIASIAFLALIALFSYGVSYASYLPQFSINRIEVAGTHALRPQLLEAFVATKLWDGSPEFLSESNIFFYPRSEIETSLKAFFPRVADVKISRESMLANAISILVEERTPFARWCMAPTVCYAMDRSGVIFTPASSTPAFETPYIFSGPLPAEGSPISQTFLPGQFSSVLVLLERLGQASFSPQRIAVADLHDFSIELGEGFLLRLAFGADVGATVKNLQLALGAEILQGKQSELQYVDLRFGNRVYYKVRGGQERKF